MDIKLQNNYDDEFLFFQATKEIREMGIESLIVGVTSVSTGSQLEAFKAAGLNICFEKPLTVDKIKSVISKLNYN